MPNKKLIEQVKNIDPSVSAPLFRRLMYKPELAYLRLDDNKIIGFEIDLQHSEPLSGYTIIGIEKHTILAFKSDDGEDLKLILFPSLEKLRDKSFGLDDLIVTKKIYSDDNFIGKGDDTGRLIDVADDLIPPKRHVEIDKQLSNILNDSDDIKNATKPKRKFEPIKRPKRKLNHDDETPNEAEKPIITDPEIDESNVNNIENSMPEDLGIDPDDLIPDSPFEDDYDESLTESYDDFNEGYDDDEPFVETPDNDLNDNQENMNTDVQHDSRSLQLNDISTDFKNLNDVVYYVVTEFGMNATLANKVRDIAVEKAENDIPKQIAFAINLYIQILDAKKEKGYDR